MFCKVATEISRVNELTKKVNAESIQQQSPPKILFEGQNSMKHQKHFRHLSNTKAETNFQEILQNIFTVKRPQDPQ